MVVASPAAVGAAVFTAAVVNEVPAAPAPSSAAPAAAFTGVVPVVNEAAGAAATAGLAVTAARCSVRLRDQQA